MSDVSFNIKDVPKLGAPFGQWDAAGLFQINDENTEGIVAADVYRWQTPRAELIVICLDAKSRKPYGGCYFWYFSDHWLKTAELDMRAFARLDACTLVDAKKEALMRAALTLVPTLAWLYDEIGVRR